MPTTTDHEDLRRLIPVPLSPVAPRLPETAEIRGENDRGGPDRGTGERMDTLRTRWASCLHRLFQVEVASAVDRWGLRFRRCHVLRIRRRVPPDQSSEVTPHPGGDHILTGDGVEMEIGPPGFGPPGRRSLDLIPLDLVPIRDLPSSPFDPPPVDSAVGAPGGHHDTADGLLTRRPPTLFDLGHPRHTVENHRSALAELGPGQSVHDGPPDDAMSRRFHTVEHDLNGRERTQTTHHPVMTEHGGVEMSAYDPGHGGLPRSRYSGDEHQQGSPIVTSTAPSSHDHTMPHNASTEAPRDGAVP